MWLTKASQNDVHIAAAAACVNCDHSMWQCQCTDFICCAGFSQAYLVLGLEWGGAVLCILLQLEGLLGLAHRLHIRCTSCWLYT